MTLGEASAGFLAQLKPAKPGYHDETRTRIQTVELLTAYLPEAELPALTPARVRDFAARWYVEQTDHTPAPRDLLNSLDEFLNWIDATTGSALREGSSALIAELQATLPRALGISTILSVQLGSRGAFAFPEFLTSFEEGGRSQYDVDVGGSTTTLEGFFRISRIEGASVEAEELISEQHVFPITFPPGAVEVLEIGYIVNLELVRAGDGWRIAACGFAYPPGTDF